MEVSTLYSTLEIIEFGLLGLFFGWWIKYLFGAEDSFSLFLKSRGYFPAGVMFLNSVLMILIIYFREFFYDNISMIMDFVSSGWLGALFALFLLILEFYMFYYIWLKTFCHVNGDEFYERFTDRRTTNKAVQLGIGKCPYCLKKISRLATKCPHCTADL